MKLQAARTFSLESLLLTTTLIAVCLGVGMLAPGLGILLAILSAPAWIRTIGIRIRRKAVGQPSSIVEKVLVFLGSLAIVTTIFVAAICTFVAVCFPLGAYSVQGNSRIPPVAPWLAGGACGLFVGVVLAFFLWRSKR